MVVIKFKYICGTIGRNWTDSWVEVKDRLLYIHDYWVEGSAGDMEMMVSEFRSSVELNFFSENSGSLFHY